MTTLGCALAVSMAGCGGGGTSAASTSTVTAPPGVQVGGTIENLASDGLVLQNGSEQLAVPNHAASFTFARQTPTQGTYGVQVLVQPTGQMCDVIHAAGTVGAAAPNDIVVECKTAVVTTIAGGTAPGSAELAAQAISLYFDHDTGIAIDGTGNLYVANSLHNVIQKIDTQNLVSIYAGSVYANGNGMIGHRDGPALESTFFRPVAVAIDSAGNLLVADNGRIRRISSAGVVTTIAGNDEIGQMDGPANVATFTNLSGIATDATGNVYVAADRLIRKIGVDGMVSTLAGSVSSGGVVSRVDGQGKGAAFLFPKGIASDRAGKLYVLDGDLVRTVTRDGVVTTLSGSAGYGTMCPPQASVAFAMGTGQQQCPGKGQPVNGPVGGATFAEPRSIAIDAKGNIYVADTNDGMIRVITPAGGVSTLAGTGSFGTTDGAGAGATLNQPIAVALDSAGNLYVAEAGGNALNFRYPSPGVLGWYPRIRKIQFQ